MPGDYCHGPSAKVHMKNARKSAILYQMRSPLFLIVLSAVIAVTPAHARPSDELDRSLHQLFDTKELQAKTFGPARWIEGGTAYTTLEPSPASKAAKEIVRYQSATGERSVLIAAAALTPLSGTAPLEIDDYQWSDDAT